jgi:hypothetical protein
MRIEVELPVGIGGDGPRVITFDDGLLDEHRRILDVAPPERPVRLAIAAARIVLGDDYAGSAHAPGAPGSPEEIAAAIDWEATAALRRHLADQGFAIAEAMDTAQRFAIGWPVARELIEACGALELPWGFVAGAGSDHLDPAEIRRPLDLVDAVVHQAGVIQEAGGAVVLLPLPWLSLHRASEADYVAVYTAIIDALQGPLLLHWLGEMFHPGLAGYFPGRSFDRILAHDPGKLRGVKLSLLDPARERRIRDGLARREQIVLTGDDLHFSELILGEGCGESPPRVEGWTELGRHRVALGAFSHGLLGIFDGIAVPAGLALRHLALGDARRYRALMEPAEELSRAIFAPPTEHYKAGLAFLAWLSGRQGNPFLANHEERSRSTAHYLRLAALAAGSGVFSDAAVAAARFELFLRAARPGRGG